jgi:hypothetical protein
MHCVAMRKEHFIYQLLPRDSPGETDEKTREIRARIAGNPTSVPIMYFCSTVLRITGHTSYPVNFTLHQFKRDNTENR